MTGWAGRRTGGRRWDRRRQERGGAWRSCHTSCLLYREMSADGGLVVGEGGGREHWSLGSLSLGREGWKQGRTLPWRAERENPVGSNHWRESHCLERLQEALRPAGRGDN